MHWNDMVGYNYKMEQYELMAQRRKDFDATDFTFLLYWAQGGEWGDDWSGQDDEQDSQLQHITQLRQFCLMISTELLEQWRQETPPCCWGEPSQLTGYNINMISHSLRLKCSPGSVGLCLRNINVKVRNLTMYIHEVRQRRECFTSVWNCY